MWFLCRRMSKNIEKSYYIPFPPPLIPCSVLIVVVAWSLLLQRLMMMMMIHVPIVCVDNSSSGDEHET